MNLNPCLSRRYCNGYTGTNIQNVDVPSGDGDDSSMPASCDSGISLHPRGPRVSFELPVCRTVQFSSLGSRSEHRHPIPADNLFPLDRVRPAPSLANPCRSCFSRPGGGALVPKVWVDFESFVFGSHMPKSRDTINHATWSETVSVGQ